MFVVDLMHAKYENALQRILKIRTNVNAEQVYGSWRRKMRSGNNRHISINLQYLW